MLGSTVDQMAIWKILGPTETHGTRDMQRTDIATKYIRSQCWSRVLQMMSRSFRMNQLRWCAILAK
jgi:hypothetical protein